MKKSFIVLALAVALVLAFAATASATSAKTWNYQEDYYSWGSSAGAGLAATGTLGAGGTAALLNSNPTNPGVHANYQTTTAKCGICHSVHRAKAGGVKLLNADYAECYGCHAAGVGTVTTKLISWQTGGPHGSGVAANCDERSCHTDNPHGANGSAYKIFNAKLLSPNGDAVLASALTSAASGITVAELNADAGSTWTEGTRSAVRTGYTCNQSGCHVQTMLPVIEKGWAEQRVTIYPTATTKMKTGHLSLGAANAAAGSYVGLDGCTSCHDQTDNGVTSGFTFPHSQTAFGAVSNTTARSYLWMTRASSAAGTDTVGLYTANEKSMDGNCIKCHRAANGTSGIGLDQ